MKTDVPAERILLSPDEVGTLIGLSIYTLFRMRKDGTFPEHTHQIGGRPRWHRNVVNNWMEEHRVKESG